ncbi:hypothetical protein QE152_g3864 [Popillia japonica]|uniref:Uncharacterized protein n=1 Tax=Popillia japonica TaxID=7064 RepID=A0AAW1MYX6_POPJA
MYLETCGYQVQSSRSVITWCIARCYQIPECTWRHVGTKCNPADLLSRGVSPDVIKNSTECTWRHVGTKCNPADLLSRGVSPDVIKNSTLW